MGLLFANKKGAHNIHPPPRILYKVFKAGEGAKCLVLAALFRPGVSTLAGDWEKPNFDPKAGGLWRGNRQGRPETFEKFKKPWEDTHMQIYK